MPSQRLAYLDNIKGVLIILVIVGHAIQYCIPNYEENFAFRFIYSFHMPLFFFVSGYLANREKWDNGLILRRAIQLLVPFFVWAFVAPLLKNGSFDVDGSVQILLYPDKGLWFLYNLFVYVSIFNIADFIHYRYGIQHWIGTGAFYLLLGMLMVMFHTKFNCSQLFYHIIFYASGFYYKQMKVVNKFSNSSICIMGGYF